MSLADLQSSDSIYDPTGSSKNYIQIDNQLSGHAKSELETDVTIETTESASAESWLGSGEQADLEMKNLESLEEEAPSAAKDNDDDDNQHSLKDMDSGDVLAYSGEISGEFKTPEPVTKTAPAKETTPAKTSSSQQAGKSQQTQQLASVDNKEEKIPRKLSINLDPALAGEGNKTLTVVSPVGAPEAVNKERKQTHEKLKEEQADIQREIAEIQKQEDSEEQEVKDDQKAEVEAKRKQLEQAQHKLKSTHARIAALEGTAHLDKIQAQLNGTEVEAGKKRTAADVTKHANDTQAAPAPPQATKANSTVPISLVQHDSFKVQNHNTTVKAGGFGLPPFNISWPSGNIQTPVSRPLDRGIDLNPFCKKEDPHGKQFDPAQQNNCKPLPGTSPGQTSHPTALTAVAETPKVEKPAHGSDDGNIQVEIAMIKARTEKLKEQTLERKHQMRDMMKVSQAKAEKEKKKAQELQVLKKAIDEKETKEKETKKPGKEMKDSKTQENNLASKDSKSTSTSPNTVAQQAKPSPTPQAPAAPAPAPPAHVPNFSQQTSVVPKPAPPSPASPPKPVPAPSSAPALPETKKEEPKPLQLSKPQQAPQSLVQAPSSNVSTAGPSQVQQTKQEQKPSSLATKSNKLEPKAIEGKGQAKDTNNKNKKTISLKKVMVGKNQTQNNVNNGKHEEPINMSGVNSNKTTSAIISKLTTAQQNKPGQIDIKTLAQNNQKKPQQQKLQILTQPQTNSGIKQALMQQKIVAQNLINSVNQGQTSIDAAVLAAAAGVQAPISAPALPPAPEPEDDGPELTYEQALKLKQKMDMDTRDAVEEGIQKTNDEASINQRAEEEAARDLGIDPSDSREYDQKFGDSYDDSGQANSIDKQTEYTADRITKHDTLNDLLHKQSFQSLTQSSTGLDSLIGASVSTEIADNDTEYLKKLSEKVAEEADQSDIDYKQNEMKKEAMERARVQNELDNKDDPNTMSVKHARELAAKMNAQLDAGVEAAEARNIAADRQIEIIKQQREEKAQAKKDPFNILHNMIKQKQSLVQAKAVSTVNSFLHPLFTARQHIATGFSL